MKLKNLNIKRYIQYNWISEYKDKANETVKRIHI